MRIKVHRILVASLECASEERHSFLAEACGDDQELRATVEQLLCAAESTDPDDFLTPGGAQRGPLWRELSAGLLSESGISEGARVGPYRVIREIGRGGMAVVYLAERADAQYEQQVALKVVKLGIDTEQVTRRFEQERQILASLRHPAIATLIDGGVTADGRPFLVMEHVDGQPIDSYCDEHRLSIEERLRFFVDVSRAVQYAHRNLVVHRDLKPSNILVTGDGHVKLLDFGIAKLLDRDASPHAAPTTLAEARVMTPEYASPEQVRDGPVTTASDVYQLGLLLYELLTGRPAHRFSGRSPSEVERVVCEQEPVLPSTAVTGRGGGAAEDRIGRMPELSGRRQRTRSARLGKRLRGDLDTIVMMALRKEPERRYATAEKLSQDIALHLAGHPVSARKDTLGYRLRKLVQRQALAVTLTAATLLLITTLSVLYALGLARERDRARMEADKANEVADFLRELFEVSDPGRAQGEEITARELLDNGAQRIAGGLEQQPEVRAEMMVVLGDIFMKLGMYDRAEPLMEEALEIRRAYWGDELGYVAPSMNALALLYSEQARYDEAEPLSREALAVAERILGPEHPDVAMGCNNLASILVARGRYQEAEALYRQALGIREKVLRPDHPDLAASLNNLGGICYLQGKYDDAGALMQRALEAREQSLGPEHPVVAESRYNLGVIHAKMGDSEQAEQLYRSALAIYEKVYGPQHPKVAMARNSLAPLSMKQGRPAEAEALLSSAVESLGHNLGAAHPQVGSYLADLAYFYAAQGRFPEAETTYQRALSIVEEALGSGHPFVAQVLDGIAAARCDQGRYGEAETLFLRALQIQEQALGPEHESVAETLLGLGRLQTEQGRYGEAEPLLARAHATLTAALGPEHPSTATGAVCLARLCTRQGRYQEAMEYLQERLEIAGRPGSESRMNTDRQLVLAETYLGLGELYEQLGRTDEARSSWSTAVSTIDGLPEGGWSGEHRSIRVTALLSLGRVEEAQPAAEQLLAQGWRRRDLLELCRRHGIPGDG